MLFKRFVEVGRVCYIVEGADAGKTCVIVDIIDQTKALVDGPCSGLIRQAIRFNDMHLTDYVIKIGRGVSTKVVRLAWEAEKINEKWNASNWSKRIEARAKRANLTDFERYKVQKAKQSRNGILRQALVAAKLKTAKKVTKTTTRSRARAQMLKAKRSKK